MWQPPCAHVGLWRGAFDRLRATSLRRPAASDSRRAARDSVARLVVWPAATGEGAAERPHVCAKCRPAEGRARLGRSAAAEAAASQQR
eukprot:CAMPEP_0176190408 /NCGR_PEP_ID=MMETSP0121_2-20121125/3924_1 /TAXON_ID=160619 /ORGANISM="Kryptoperidinium foliaceum, Strain CCMP 1326" /LENGTH=87 /DNA_ID=CAMNT_0017529031 /DNA_START=42 /DNA_END=301 /DNA_ORIENTATION=-